MTELTKKDREFKWTGEQVESFDNLKRALLTPPIMGYPNYDQPMKIHCDASGYGLGAVLVQ